MPHTARAGGHWQRGHYLPGPHKPPPRAISVEDPVGFLFQLVTLQSPLKKKRLGPAPAAKKLNTSLRIRRPVIGTRPVPLTRRRLGLRLSGP